MLKSKNIYLVPLIGYTILIIAGWIILKMPFSNNGNVGILDALFTSVSATCVNGITTVNIAKDYTFIGQLVIAILIEIGAIGFVTFISFVLNIKRKKMKLSQSVLLNSALNNNDFSNLKQRLQEVIKYTLVIELIGAIALCVKFIPSYGFENGIWLSLFHSITAFCNAGFDLFGTNSLIQFTNDVYINIVLIILMLLGSIGFFVIEDIIQCIKNRSFLHIKFHTKIVLATSLIIYVMSIIILKILEPKLTILQLLFTSATARTTGFSIVNMASLSEYTKVFISILMMIGGAPGSTSGGIRITSIAVMFLVTHAVLRDKKEITIFYKKIDLQTVRQAIANIIICNIVVAIGVIVFSKVENIGLIDNLFMCVSSFSATGLATVNAGLLMVASKLVLMLLMFIGRIGPIALLSIFIFNKKENKNIEYVSGNLML